MSASQNYYKLLRVREDAPEPVIKQAFRKLARECHPDLHPNNPEAEVMFKLLQEAYDVLGDRVKRRQYDRLRTLTGSGEGFNFTVPPEAESNENSQIIDPNRIYTQGVQLAAQRKYDLADQRFSQALELNPDFVEAYMGRCQVRYVLGDDRGVLDDCTAIIRIRSQIPQAHYYQGRARHRLNYVEHAIQAYSNAITLDQKYASAYYYRGLAKADVLEKKGAIADFKAASQLYRLTGNQKGLLRAESQLRQLRRQSITNPVERVQSFGSYFSEALTNPVGTSLPLFRALSSSQASQVGFGLGFVAIAAMVVSGSLYWSTQLQLPWYQIAFLGAIPFITISLISSIGSLIAQSQLGNWSGDVFVAGMTLTPLGGGSLLTGLHAWFGTRFVWAIGAAVSCLTVMLLYSGLTQISRFSEAQATWIVIFTVILNFFLIEGLHHFFSV